MSLIDIDESPQAQPSQDSVSRDVPVSTGPPQEHDYDWGRDSFMHHIVSISNTLHGNLAALREIVSIFPQVQHNDALLWLAYMKNCCEYGIPARPFVMDHFRNISWFEQLVTNGSLIYDAPELVALCLPEVFRPGETVGDPDPERVPTPYLPSTPTPTHPSTIEAARDLPGDVPSTSTPTHPSTIEAARDLPGGVDRDRMHPPQLDAGHTEVTEIVPPVVRDRAHLEGNSPFGRPRSIVNVVAGQLHVKSINVTQSY
ncbi:hypothetical protein AURDEDRAFT_169302 [Auricularia subglabra TFB-10046 SS5]|nr:hypothetical protein AURDEDRAFT_169302 [Auricularia subglabra TFB-10046 SS5]